MNSDNPYDSPISCFSSQFAFDGQGCGAAVIFCSDGRFADQVNDFMQNGLGLFGYDRLAIAGGPACFAGHFDAYREEEAAISHLKFLVKLHSLTRLILISHEHCGFYSDFLKVHEIDLLQRMKMDLASAVRRVRAAAPHLQVEAYLARLDGSEVWFEPVTT